MLNQIVLVGRIKNMKDIENGMQLILEVRRIYINEEGEYETDFIPFTLREGIAKNVKEYCNIDDLVGIKGYVKNNNNNIELIAEKITFLATNKKPDDVLNEKDGK